MSHYTVLVIGDDVEAALEPFQQYRSDEPGEYLVFVDREADLRREYETDGEGKLVKLANGRVWDGHDPRFFALAECRFVYPADAKIVVQKPYRDTYPTFEDFVRAEEDEVGERDATTGRYGYWENPNGKFDWHRLGGRWKGFFKLKAGTNGIEGEKSPFVTYPEVSGHAADSCLVAAIDFEMTASAAADAALEQWDDAHAEDTPEVVRKSLGMLGLTREEFGAKAAKRSLGTHAVLLNGVWYEREDARTWGSGRAGVTEEEWVEEVTALVKGLPADTRVSLVDCHR